MRGFVITYPECIMDEVEPAIEKLSSMTDLSILDIKEIQEDTHADFLIIPGGSCDDAIFDKELHSLIKRTKDRGLLAGICNGALVLASAGVLVGKKCTHTAVPKYAPVPQFEELLRVAGELFEGSTYVDEDVVVSDNIITAKPHVPELFANTILEAISQKLT